PENVDAEAGVGAIQFFIECAYEYDAPESFYGAFGLTPAAQPFQHGDWARCSEVGGFSFGGDDIEHGAGDGEFVAHGERREGKKRTGHVEGRREKAGFHG